MKFGIFYELQLPKPWSRDDEYELLNHALDQIELADGLGYDYAWEVEHHFLEEYSHSSAPEVFLAAASQRTKNIRLGHGIVQLPTNHPARVAERVSTLDLLSHGRVELGVGEGSSVTELHPFDRRFRDKRAVWEDAMRCLLPMFWEEGWEYHGEYFDFPLRNVIPKPRQQPHPPLWVACSQLETIEMAGRRGIGALGFQFVSRRGRRRLGQRVLQLVRQASRPARAVPDEPEHRRRQPVHVRADRRGGAPSGPTARRSSSSRCASTTTTDRSSPARSACGTSTRPGSPARRARRPRAAASSGHRPRSAASCTASPSPTSTR